MKVLMRDTFLPGNPYSYELCGQLKEYVDLVLLCRRDVELPDGDIKCRRIIYARGSNKLASIGHYIKSLLQELTELKKGRYDIYHIQSYKNLYFEVPLFYLAKRYCKAVVTTVHNVLPHEVSGSDRKLHEQWYRVSDALIVHNEATRRSLIKEFPFTASKVYVVPHGTYSARTGKREKKEKNGRVKFLLFGQFRPYKGIDILIRAIPHLSARVRAEIQVVIAGSQHPKQDRTDYLKMLHEYQAEDCVELQRRRISDEELPELFGEADFCLFPYREIYGSGALLMAYTYRRPVIASNVAAFVEETDGGRTGLLFENESPEDLAKKIEEAVSLDRKAIDGYKAAISELVEKKYSWKVSAEKLAEIYRTISGGKTV